jgi:hypothetical protein
LNRKDAKNAKIHAKFLDVENDWRWSHMLAQKKVSRKGAKTQRKSTCEFGILNGFA